MAPVRIHRRFIRACYYACRERGPGRRGRTLFGRRHTRRRTIMNRRGLWAGGVALILLVVGAAALTTVGAGYAKNEDASRAKCSEATLDGTYLFAYDGVVIKGDEQLPFAYA